MWFARLARKRLVRDLAADRRGVSVVEFAFVAPIFLTMLMAVFDFGFLIYAKAVLQGAVEDGARSASLENTEWTTIKNRVNAQVRAVIPAENASTDISFTFDPTYYGNYADVGPARGLHRLEQQRAARFDRVLRRPQLQPHLRYRRRPGRPRRRAGCRLDQCRGDLQAHLPLWSMIGQSQDYTIAAQTYLRNQPFSAQAARVGVRICP
jgi:hypothetical protein